jgi:hypothetical protein
MTIEDRLRQAIAEEVMTVTRPPDRWGEIEARAAAAARARHIRRRNGVRAAIGLLAAAAVAIVGVPLLRNQPVHRVRTTPATSPATGPVPGPAPTAGPAPVVTAPGPTISLAPPATTTTAPPTVVFHYTPLWPFRTQAEALAWEAAYRSGGQQPWHLDPGQTALSFTDGYLGFTAINKVVTQTVSATEAHVAVGFATSNGQSSTAAVIHLVRFGTGPSAPWEVVGTDDTTLSMTLPAYGSLGSSPLTVGGVITGVDESISVVVRQVSTAGPLGQSCCLPAGGNNTPWRMTVSFQGATDPVLTIVAATGGHLQTVERFTVTGVRTGR